MAESWRLPSREQTMVLVDNAVWTHKSQPWPALNLPGRAENGLLAASHGAHYVPAEDRLALITMTDCFALIFAGGKEIMPDTKEKCTKVWIKDAPELIPTANVRNSRESIVRNIVIAHCYDLQLF